ncbi:DNA-binding transcriptional LysR family regulator [Sphingomonas zeicaulis]|uniref:LysR family transcriptional regulator n=1 Tax=Sphingomonas zeicaulis TaxID=1632740 RepID=UPI003D190882
MDRIAAVRAFIGVAEFGSFNGAARAQGVSPSVITKHIQFLEQDLGTTLLQRNTRRVVLTDAGSLYRERWCKILLDIAAADAAVGEDHREMKGSLKIGAPAAFGRVVVAPLAVSFLREHGGVAIDLVFSNSATDPLSAKVDVLFRVGAPPAIDLASVSARRLASFPMILCASPDYLDRFGEPASIEALRDHVCVNRILAGQSGGSPWRFVRAGVPIEVPTSSAIRANSADAVISAGIHGQGLIYLPACLVQDQLHAGRLRRIEFDAEMGEAPLSALWQNDRHVPARLRAFVNHCASHLPTMDVTHPVAH